MNTSPRSETPPAGPPAHRIEATPALRGEAPQVQTDSAVVASFLEDAAHVPGGYAAGVAFPKDEAEVAALVTRATRVLPVGTQSSLTGGATPRGGLVLSTRALTRLERLDGDRVRVGAGVPLFELQRMLAAEGKYYPPVPTFDGATVGGTIATNAAGAATFKYGSTRRWVESVSVVLADGSRLDVHRGAVTASPEGIFEIARAAGGTTTLAIPTYRMPAVAKLSAGYFAMPGMDLVDLFVGSEGTLGIVVAATLRVLPKPRRWVAVLRCDGMAQALMVTAALREAALDAWRGSGPLDVSAVELVDDRALQAMPEEAFTRARLPRPPFGATLLVVQIESADDDTTLAALHDVVERCGIAGDLHLAAPDDDRGATRLFELREAAPRAVNALVAAAKHTDPRIEKTAGDMVVPFARLAESIDLYRRTFARHELDYALWGHASDGNLHPNVIPRSFQDVERGREAIVEIAHAIVQMGGAPLAEHGVGRSALKQQLLRELYGDTGIEEMRAVKQALDPTCKLAPGVLFPER